MPYSGALWHSTLSLSSWAVGSATPPQLFSSYREQPLSSSWLDPHLRIWKSRSHLNAAGQVWRLLSVGRGLSWSIPSREQDIYILCNCMDLFYSKTLSYKQHSHWLVLDSALIRNPCLHSPLGKIGSWSGFFHPVVPCRWMYKYRERQDSSIPSKWSQTKESDPSSNSPALCPGWTEDLHWR